jgi:baculoviral IAP repeat-containing protein 2/3
MIVFFIESSTRSIPSNNIPIEPATSSEDACKVCLDAEANCAFIECGHIVACLNCAKLLTKCPICRETIKRTLRVYKS